jgi:hypothetical protein
MRDAFPDGSYAVAAARPVVVQHRTFRGMSMASVVAAQHLQLLYFQHFLVEVQGHLTT